jgi:hypothetical protein
MLIEEQAKELLIRCENIVGMKLRQTRGNLRSSTNRASAVWELIVLEAASKLGEIEYEPYFGGCPDIRLCIPNHRPLWIEVAYLYPRFWKNERKSNNVVHWLFKEAGRFGIPAQRIQPRFDGIDKKGAGPIRILPEINERKAFLKSPEIKGFFSKIIEKPDLPHSCAHSKYTISVTYNPKGQFITWGGLLQESPTKIQEHAVYRLLNDKARQHDIEGPRIVCIGSDQSPALSSMVSPGNPTLPKAVEASFRKHRSLSASIVVQIETSASVFSQFEKSAKPELFLNANAREPLTEKEVGLIYKLNFNRWKYSYSALKWESEQTPRCRRVSGNLTTRSTQMGIEIEIPSSLVIDSLAGKKSLTDEFNFKDNDQILRALKDRWIIKSCKLKEGNIEAGEDSKIVFELIPPELEPFWPKKNCIKT